MRFGRHMPTGSHPVQALRQAQEIGGDAMQIFVSNPRGWAAPAGNEKAEQAFRATREALDNMPVVVHAAYLINLASPNDDFFAKSVMLLSATLERAARFGAESVVFHIGSSGGAGEEAGIARLADGVTRTLESAANADGVRLLLENDVGGGAKLGYRFENLAATLDRLPQYAARLGVCLDTAHLWGAGFDIGTPESAAEVLAEADRTIGLQRVRALHVNDSRWPLGSHRDEHARLGAGTIPLAGMQAFLRSPHLAHTTALLETPIPTQSNGETDWLAERAFMVHARELAGCPSIYSVSSAE